MLAVAVAVVLSPLAPIGPVRPVYPDRGVAFDWTVLGLGFALLVVVLSAIGGGRGLAGRRRTAPADRAGSAAAPAWPGWPPPAACRPPR